MTVLTTTEQALLRAVIDWIYPADAFPSATGLGADKYIFPMLDGDAKAIREMVRYGLGELARAGFVDKSTSEQDRLLQAESREPLLRSLDLRIRDVQQSRDGFIFVATERRFGGADADGTILRLEPYEGS